MMHPTDRMRKEFMYYSTFPLHCTVCTAALWLARSCVMLHIGISVVYHIFVFNSYRTRSAIYPETIIKVIAQDRVRQVYTICTARKIYESKL